MGRKTRANNVIRWNRGPVSLANFFGASPTHCKLKQSVSWMNGHCGELSNEITKSYTQRDRFKVQGWKRIDYYRDMLATTSTFFLLPSSAHCRTWRKARAQEGHFPKESDKGASIRKRIKSGVLNFEARHQRTWHGVALFSLVILLHNANERHKKQWLYKTLESHYNASVHYSNFLLFLQLSTDKHGGQFREAAERKKRKHLDDFDRCRKTQ